MKLNKLYFLIVFLSLIALCPCMAQDTISVELGDKAIILIVTQDRDGLQRVRELNLNQIIRDVTANLDTSKIKEEQEVKIYEYTLDADSKKLTLTEIKDDNFFDENNETVYPTFDTNWKSYGRSFWAVEFGLNNYLEDGQFPDSQGQTLWFKSQCFTLFCDWVLSESPYWWQKNTI